MENEEITSVNLLKFKSRYFSKSMNEHFTVLKIEKEKQQINIGVNGKIKKIDFHTFNKTYLKEGVIEE